MSSPRYFFRGAGGASLRRFHRLIFRVPHSLRRSQRVRLWLCSPVRSRNFRVRVAQACFAKLIEVIAAPRPYLGVHASAPSAQVGSRRFFIRKAAHPLPTPPSIENPHPESRRVRHPSLPPRKDGARMIYSLRAASGNHFLTHIPCATRPHPARSRLAGSDGAQTG